MHYAARHQTLTEVHETGAAGSADALLDRAPDLLKQARVRELLEFDRSEHPFRQAVLMEPIGHEAGVIDIPNGPGLGVEVNRDAVERFTTPG